LGEREGVSLAEIKKYASISIKAKNIGNAPKKMAEGDLVAIYRASMKIV
jgi:hypothetical protein